MMIGEQDGKDGNDDDDDDDDLVVVVVVREVLVEIHIIQVSNNSTHHKK